MAVVLLIGAAVLFVPWMDCVGCKNLGAAYCSLCGGETKVSPWMIWKNTRVRYR